MNRPPRLKGALSELKSRLEGAIRDVVAFYSVEKFLAELKASPLMVHEIIFIFSVNVGWDEMT